MGEGTDEVPWSLDKLNDFRFCSLLQLSEQTIAPSIDPAAAASVPKSGKFPVAQHFLSSNVHYKQIRSSQVGQLSSDVLPPPVLLYTIPAGISSEGYVLPISNADDGKSYCTSGTSNALHPLNFSENPLLSQSSHPSVNGVSSAKVNARFTSSMNGDSASNFDKALIISQNDEVSTNAIVPRNHSMEENSDGGRYNTVVTLSAEGAKSEARNKAALNSRLRRARITEGIQALENCVPCSVHGSKETVLDDAIDYIKFLKLQLKVLSQSRLNGEPAKYPFVYVEGYGHYLIHEHFSGEPLEEMMGQLIESDMEAASDLLGSKGLSILPADLTSSLLHTG